MKTKTMAHVSDAVTPWEEESKKVAYQAALEGIVLLENDGVLPLQPGKVALFGAGGAMTVKGGTGSGEVNERHSISILEGLEQRGFQVTTRAWLKAYEDTYRTGEEAYRREFHRRLRKLNITGLINLMQDPLGYPFGPPVSQEDLKNSDTDTCIYVVSRQAGEGSDRKLSRHDYTLSPQERENIALCAGCFQKTVLVINTGGPFQLDFLEEIPGIRAVIFYAQQGGMGGAALADLLTGKANFSGKLTDTWASRYEDIPFAMDYSYLNGNLEEEYYREGIYVGYRYFDTFGVKPRYPFGYGLSYTHFSVKLLEAGAEDGRVTVRAAVTNIGNCPGAEVVQLYASCPQSKTLPKEYQRLTAFEKTRLLAPGETETLSMTFRPEDLASFRETDAATVLESGNYLLRLGTSSRDTRLCAYIRVERETVLSRHQHICPLKKELEELRAPVLSLELPGEELPCIVLRETDLKRIDPVYREPDIPEDPRVTEIMESLRQKELIALTVGGGFFGRRPFDAPGAAGVTTGKLLKKGVPNAVLADGPAGLRLQQCTVRLKSGALKPVKPPMMQMEYLPGFVKRILLADPKKGTPLYQFATAFPVELALAQTWNRELVRQVGQAVSTEMSAYGVDFWLAPALNIHRNPLCGRNFEYYSEDPFLSGVLAAAAVQGVQSVPGKLATVKHFACNNQEDNRNRTNANVSERALREIYLRGFRIAVEEGKPGAVMSSYNRVNGVYTPNSYDLLTKVLRNEWGFQGLVMTDWFSTGRKLGDNALCLKAGNDLIMPGDLSAPGSGRCARDIRRALRRGRITQTDLRRCSANVLHAVLYSVRDKRL